MHVELRRLAAGSLLCFFTASHSTAQNIRNPVAGDHVQLNVYGKSGAGAHSLGSNPAALAFSRTPAVSFYSERRFLLPELALYRVSGTMPAFSGGFALHAARFGHAMHNESGIALGYGRKLSPRIALGAQFNIFSFATAGYRSYTAVNFEMGFLLHLPDGLRAGIHIYNPKGTSTSTDNAEVLPALYSFGLGYEVAQNFSISAITSKGDAGPIIVRCGLQYSFAGDYVARLGFNAAAGCYYLGSGVRMKALRIDATVSIHPQLGLTPGILLLWNKEEKD